MTSTQAMGVSMATSPKSNSCKMLAHISQGLHSRSNRESHQTGSFSLPALPPAETAASGWTDSSPPRFSSRLSGPPPPAAFLSEERGQIMIPRRRQNRQRVAAPRGLSPPAALLSAPEASLWSGAPGWLDSADPLSGCAPAPFPSADLSARPDPSPENEPRVSPLLPWPSLHPAECGPARQKVALTCKLIFAHFLSLAKSDILRKMRVTSLKRSNSLSSFWNSLSYSSFRAFMY